MPSPLAHSAVACILLPLAPRVQMNALPQWRRHAFAAAVVGAAIGPDIDFALLLVSSDHAIEMHGGPTHSFATAIVFGSLFAGVCRALTGFPLARLWMIGTLAWASHVAMDALAPGRGVAILWPLTGERMGSAVPLFVGVRHSDVTAAGAHVLTVLSEIPFILLMWWGGRALRRRRDGEQQRASWMWRARRTGGVA